MQWALLENGLPFEFPPPSQDQSPSVPAEGGNTGAGGTRKKESCFPRGTSGIAFVIGTNNVRTVPFVPLVSRRPLIPDEGGDERVRLG